MLKNMALSGIKVIEMSGLAPVPFCGMILSDFGARVIRVDKTSDMMAPDSLCRGKQSIAINLKDESGVKIVEKLCEDADVLIDPYRPGVLEKLGLGPEKMTSRNPRLIYARLTGFGQEGYYANRAGHDINYLAISGVLSKLGRKHEKPYAPINLLADFAGGGLMCAFGITLALLERNISGRGQVIDANMVEGAAYVGSFLWKTQHSQLWGKNRGEGWLDGGYHFYETYETKDNKYMSVGALEPQFYNNLLKGLDLSHQECPQFGDPEQNKVKVAEAFAQKTQAEWSSIFDNLDACVAPILDLNEVHKHVHNKEKKSFLHNYESNSMEPKPAPSLSRTPGVSKCLHHPGIGENSKEILLEHGYSVEQIDNLFSDGVVVQNSQSKL